MGKQIINGDVEITGQLLKGDLKALYHLGAYDLVDTSNADYDLVTRGTGYATTFRELAKQIGGTTYGDGVPSWASTRQSINTTMFASGNIKSIYPIMTNDSAWGYSGDSNIIIGYSSDRISVYGKSPLTGAILLDTLIEIEYRLSTTYTEKVLKNQPLSQLDQNGENWLRGEYEKQLNLFPSGYINPSSIPQYYSKNINAGIELKVGQTYNLSFIETYSSGEYFIYIVASNTYYPQNGFSQYRSINGPEWGNISDLGTYQQIYRNWRNSSSDRRNISFTAQYKYLYVIYCSAVSGNFTFGDPMLNSGSTALPYQPYNGKVMHAIDVEGVLLWQNGDEDTSFGEQTISVPDMSAYKYLMFGFKINSSATSITQYFKIKCKNSSGGYAWFSFIDDTTTDTYKRTIKINSMTSITFNEGYRNSSATSSSCIPTTIYGIK